MHRLTLGDFELTVFSDGTYPLDGGAFFSVVPKVLWSKKVTADECNYVTAGLNSLMIRMERPPREAHGSGSARDTLTVLIETGIGNKLSDRMIKIYGQPAQLLENLAAAGIAPEDVDIVINSHLHFDHCGWNTVRDKNGRIVPTFPRAKYYAPEGEWEYARHPSERDAISYISENYDPLVESGQMTLLKGGETIVPGISVETFPGHTASMMGVVVSGDGENPHFSQNRGEVGHPQSLTRASSQASSQASSRDSTACYISDLIPTTAHIDLTWGMGFDLYPLQTIESKKRYYARAIPERWLTVFTHDPKTPWAYVEKGEANKLIAKPA
jgi:glyoxylase-like metal-dependent hydrolase (beta-lactamase superfamily II)